MSELCLGGLKYFVEVESFNVIEAKGATKSFMQNIINFDPILQEHRVKIYLIKNVKTLPSLLEKYLAFYVSYGGVEYYSDLLCGIVISQKILFQSVEHLIEFIK